MMAAIRTSITAAALARPRFFMISALLVCLMGLVALFDFPATEEPPVTLRLATVEAYLPGESPERIEQILVRPIEEAIRSQSEVKTIDTQIRPGSVLVYVSLRDSVAGKDVPGVWQRIRARLLEAQPNLPAGTIGPRLNDDFGRVAVRTFAVTGKGFTAAQLEQWAKHVRNQLQGAPGVATISLHGVRREIAYVDLNPEYVREVGTDVSTIARALFDRNQLAPTGQVTQGTTSLAIQAGDQVRTIDQLAAFPVPLGQGRVVPLGSFGTIRQIAEDPPRGGAFYNGKPAVVLGVSMQNGLNVISFADGLDQRLETVKASLPAGLSVMPITDQASVVAKDLKKVGQVFIETVIVVLGVVMFFLGWRSGLVTGAIVPMTVLGTLLIMHLLDIQLHQVSIAAIIIALGIFVDNGIVVVEDYQRRVSEGEPALDAARAAGETMLAPLLVSSLAIIFAFSPLVAGETETAEYMRSLGIVFAITLLLSLFLALTITPLLSLRYIPADVHHEENDDDFIGKIKTFYARLIVRILEMPRKVAVGMAALLAVSLMLIQFVPTELFSPSQRKQLQMPIELSGSASAQQTMITAGKISAMLADRKQFPDITGQVIYVADGGPRFILGLNPPSPTLNRAYAVINVDEDADLEDVIARIENKLAPRFPEARLDPKRFFLGSAETGVAVFRLVGPDREALRAGAAKLQTALEGMEGMHRVRTNMEAPVMRLVISVDQAKVAAAGLSNAAVFNAINAIQDGSVATVMRSEGIDIPVVVRAGRDDRSTLEQLGSLPVGPAASGISLGSVATIRFADQQSLLARRDLMPMVEVTALHDSMTSAQIVADAQETIDSLGLPDLHAVALGGEIEESAKADEGLVTYAPIALIAMVLLFLWQFGSLRKTMIIIASMPFVIIGATLGLTISGQPLSFSATIGILALMGIIVNNAILLLGRIAEDREAGMPLAAAIAHAGEMRLRPIVMTKLVCIAGLVPLFLFGGDLWRPMAAAMMGGLALGTLITLVLIPALYAIAFGRKGDDIAAPAQGAAA
jgi:multidrug efflux pump subunit AcrB